MNSFHKEGSGQSVEKGLKNEFYTDLGVTVRVN